LGIPKLKPEKSDNYTLGIGLKPTTRLSITLDYYTILISDRIVYSSAISSTNTATTLYKILNASELVSIQFFINGIKTRTRGLDFVGNYKNIQLGKGKAQINMAANYTFTNKIIGHPKDPAAIAEAGSSILNREISSLLTKSRPKYKVIGGADYSISKWDINLNSTVFGPVQFQDLNNGGVVMNNIAQVFKTRAVTDVTVGFKFCPKISANITVENILNILPKWDLELTGNSTDPDYNEAVATLNSPAKKSLLRSFIGFNNRFDITGYYGSHFSRLGTIFHGTVTFRF
jgi:iron complex outermembrane receptor protein